MKIFVTRCDTSDFVTRSNERQGPITWCSGGGGGRVQGRCVIPTPMSDPMSLPALMTRLMIAHFDSMSNTFSCSHNCRSKGDGHHPRHPPSVAVLQFDKHS